MKDKKNNVQLILLLVFVLVLGVGSVCGADFAIITADGTLTGNETDFKDYIVANTVFTYYGTLDDSLTNFSSYVGLVDTLYVSESAAGGVLGQKLNTINIPMIIAQYVTWVNARMCTSSSESQRLSVNIVNNTHDITSWTTIGNHDYASILQTNYARCLSSSWTSDAMILGEYPGDSSRSIYMVYDKGDNLTDSSTASNIRIQHGVRTLIFYDWTDWQKNITIEMFDYTINDSAGSTPLELTNISFNTNCTNQNITTSYTESGTTYVISDIRKYSPNDDSLMMHLALNSDNTTQVDSSGNGNDGTVTGATFTTDTPIPTNDGSYSFDGNDTNNSITLSTSSLFSGYTSATWSAWVYPFSNVDNYEVMFKNWDIAMGTMCGMQNDTGTFFMATTNVNNNVGEWVYLTCKFNGTTLLSYKNGIHQSTTSINGGSIDIGTGDLLIGKDNNGYFNGSIDDPKIWNRSLSLTEIESEYLRGVGGCSLATLNMPFAVNSSTTAKDYSTYENDGTITSATWSSEKGGSYIFDGINDKIIKDVTNYSTNIFTMSFWVKSGNNSANENKAMFSSDDSSSAGSFQLSHTVTTFNYRFLHVDFNFEYGVPKHGTWEHIFIVSNGTKYSAYIDNVYSAGIIRSHNCSFNKYKIGVNRGSAEFFNGSISDFMIFDYALSDNQRTALYNNGLENKSMETLVADETETGDVYGFNLTATNSTHEVSYLNSFTVDACSVPSGDTLNITSVSDSSTSTTATITWTTNINSNSTVEYGENTSMIDTAYNSTMTTSHTVHLTGLTASTSYYYNVSSTNGTLSNESGIYNFTTTSAGGGNASANVIINLTFDSSGTPWDDTSNLDHTFSSHGTANWVNRSFCKWYGCINLTATSGDYLSSTAKWNNLDTGMAVSFWYYMTADPTDSSQGFYQLGGDSTFKWTQEGDYGYSTEWRALTGKINDNVGSSKSSETNTWYHAFLQYDETRYTVWRNGILVRNISASYGDLNHTYGDLINIGAGIYGIDLIGYLDEFVLYNTTFSDSEVLAIYNLRKDGTPPDLDVFVKDINYTLPINYSDSNNVLTQGGTMYIYFTLKNQGIENSNNFKWNITLEDNLICNGTSQLNAGEEKEFNCSWTTSTGFHKGYLNLNTSDDDDTSNNAQRIYIPFIDRPWGHFSMDEWTNTIEPYSSNASNVIAYDSYGWSKGFTSEDFNNGWDGDNVDPRGKKGRENAQGCFLNDYDPTKDSCIRAKNHLFGWANRTVTTYTDVQAIHELIHVGMIYDLMMPNLTQAENELVAGQLHDICQQVTNLDNTRPDEDDKDYISGGNGWGFGSGMGGFCYLILGANKENPTMIQDRSQYYASGSIVDQWIDRETSYLEGYKNDSWAKYQEGWLYKFYSQYHLVENLFLQKRNNLSDLDEYQNALCAMGRELITDILDFNYNGETLRNDNDQLYRGVQRGDSYSYVDIGSGSFVSADIMTFYGVLCDDVEVKQSLLWLREKFHDKGEGDNGYISTYLHKQLVDEAGSAVSPETNFPKFMFDNANDIITVRTNYTYVNDTIIQIDGGEEKGGGHSQAQGYYLYALGEPFLDFEQVPYEDDVRMDVWKNGISLQNTTQTVEGTGGVWKNNIGDYGYNQYYGNDGVAYYSTDYPNYRTFPLAYGGDIEDYVGTMNGDVMGAYNYRGYHNADPIKEYFVKFGDMLVKRTIVSGNTQGAGVYHNFINLYDEFNQTITGTTLLLERNDTNKNLKIDLIYSDDTMTMNGGETSISSCYGKTGCSGSERGNSNYARNYLYTTSDNIDFIIVHNWFYDGEEASFGSLTSFFPDGSDKGVWNAITNDRIHFDVDNDGDSQFGDRKTDGWAMAWNDDTNQYAAFGATSYIDSSSTTLFTSNKKISFHVKHNTTINEVTVNTMDDVDSPGFDQSQTARITVDCNNQPYNANFIITNSNGDDIEPVSEVDGVVTFDVISGQNSEVYTIIGHLYSSNYVPVIENYSPMNGTLTNNITLYINASDRNDDTLVYYFYNETNELYSGFLNTYDWNISDGDYTWNAIISDGTANTTLTNQTFTLETSQPTGTVNFTDNTPTLTYDVNITDNSINYCYETITNSTQNIITCVGEFNITMINGIIYTGSIYGLDTAGNIGLIYTQPSITYDSSEGGDTGGGGDSPPDTPPDDDTQNPQHNGGTSSLFDKVTADSSIEYSESVIFGDLIIDPALIILRRAKGSSYLNDIKFTNTGLVDKNVTIKSMAENQYISVEFVTSEGLSTNLNNIIPKASGLQTNYIYFRYKLLVSDAAITGKEYIVKYIVIDEDTNQETELYFKVIIDDSILARLGLGTISPFMNTPLYTYDFCTYDDLNSEDCIPTRIALKVWHIFIGMFTAIGGVFIILMIK